MSDKSLLDKIQNYDRSWCYQYQKRLDTLKEDLSAYGWTEDSIKNISLDDFEFKPITSDIEKKEAAEFIKRYEWLGTIGSFPTNWFTARYKGILGGVIIMSMPNSFSKLLGDETKKTRKTYIQGCFCFLVSF